MVHCHLCIGNSLLQWDPPALEYVTKDMVDAYFAPLGEFDAELKLPTETREAFVWSNRSFHGPGLINVLLCEAIIFGSAQSEDGQTNRVPYSLAYWILSAKENLCYFFITCHKHASLPYKDPGAVQVLCAQRLVIAEFRCSPCWAHRFVRYPAAQLRELSVPAWPALSSRHSAVLPVRPRFTKMPLSPLPFSLCQPHRRTSPWAGSVRRPCCGSSEKPSLG